MTRIPIIFLPALILTAAVLLLITPSSAATTITVDDDGGAEYEKIQDAIDAAEDGDTILVKEGLYKENVVVDKTLTLVGEGNESTTIEKGGTVVELRAHWVNISGFKIKNGDYCISVYSDHTRIVENTCVSNVSFNEIGIILWSSATDTFVSGNTCYVKGDYSTGISLSLSGYNHISNNTCYALDGTGIHLWRSSNNTFSYNTCTDSKYGFYVTESENNSFLNNTGKNNTYSMYIKDDSKNNVISNNTFSESYMGIYFVQYSPNNIICNNICDGGEWGICLSRECDNNLVEGNVVINYTNGISLSNDNVIKKNRLLFNNIGIRIFDDYGNRIINNTIYSNKNGIELTHSSKNNTAHNNFFYNNTEYAINATDNEGYTINATNNWFGHTSGPFHPESNSAGKGDNVTDYVIFDPWLKKPQDYMPVVPLIESISPNPAVVSETVVLLASVTDNRTIESYAWRNETEEIYNGTEATFTLTNLSAGTYTIYLKVQDSYGIWSKEVSDELIVHKKPTASILEITPSPAVNTENVHFSGQGADDGSISCYVWRSSLDEELYSGAEAEFDTTGLLVGNHTIFLKVQDNYGVWSEEVNTTLIVHEKPVASIDSISPNPAFDTDTIQFFGNGTDDGEIVRFVWSSNIDDEIYNDTASSFSHSNLTPGTHTITLKVQDNYGAWSDEATAPLTINEYIPPNKLPTVTITSPKNGSDVKGTVAIKGTASDEDGTIEKVEISINGDDWIEVTGIDSWNYEWDTTTVKNGEYEIKARAFDGEDYSEEITWIVTVENEDSGDGEAGFLPGFELTGAILGILAAGIYLWKRP